MSAAELRIAPELDLDAVLALYEVVGWTAYTRVPDSIAAGLRGASFVAAAFVDDRLVGLIRAVSDDATICYVQDVLVHPDTQRTGVGRALVNAVLDRYRHVRQHVLLTDDEPTQRAFYESLGYTEIRDVEGAHLRAFVRFAR
jgi:GNAT superfamily N-acetyltransferase